MAEDFDNHRRIFDRGDDLQGAAAIRAVLHVDVQDPFEQPGPAHARGRPRPRSGTKEHFRHGHGALKMLWRGRPRDYDEGGAGLQACIKKSALAGFSP